MKRKKLEAAADYLRRKAGGDLDCAIVLGSGFGAVLRDRIDGTTVPYKKVPGMPLPGVVGHAGEAHVGTLQGRRVVAFSGRFHLYEGRATNEVIYPVLVAAHAGARTFILTNAAGGVNPAYRAGDLMLLSDQLNLAGPAYETPAEARYLRTIGADAVGMSTVLEAIAARALGREIAGISLITNVHGTGEPTSHEEVLETAARSAENVAKLVEGIVTGLDPATGSQEQSA